MAHHGHQVGGLGQVHPADATATQVANAVRHEAEQKHGSAFKQFTPVEYATQVSNFIELAEK